MSIRNYNPPKFIQLEDGSVVIFPHRDHAYGFLASLGEISERCAGVISLQKNGIMFHLLKREDGKEPPPLIDSGDMYFVSSEGSYSDTKFRWFDAIFTSEEKAKLYADRRPNPIIVRGIWKDVLMRNYKTPRHLCIPTVNAELSPLMLKRMMDLLFMEPFSVQVFD